MKKTERSFFLGFWSWGFSLLQGLFSYGKIDRSWRSSIALWPYDPRYRLRRVWQEGNVVYEVFCGILLFDSLSMTTMKSCHSSVNLVIFIPPLVHSSMKSRQSCMKLYQCRKVRAVYWGRREETYFRHWELGNPTVTRSPSSVVNVSLTHYPNGCLTNSSHFGVSKGLLNANLLISKAATDRWPVELESDLLQILFGLIICLLWA